MKTKKPWWGILALLTLVVLLLAALVLPPLMPNPKAWASRIQAVNHIASISLTLPSTNVPNGNTK